MDYDKSDIASVYDDARAFAPEVLRQWLGVLSAHLAGRVISLIIDLFSWVGRGVFALTRFRRCLRPEGPSVRAP
jgi:hypothetical protein